MTPTVASERTPGRARPGIRMGRRSREAVVFSVATAVGLLHALDDAFFHRQPGVGVGQHALAAAVSLAGGVTAIYLFPALRPALRSALAFLFGALATVNGLLHVRHIADQGAAASDLTGALVAAAGVVLIGLAIAIPWLHRGEGGAGPRRRWTYRVLAVSVGLVAVFYIVVPMGIALTETHKYREAIGSPPSADYREVSFKASDGVKLSGWYRPTQNGATILVVHGGGGDRTGAVAHAKLLVRHGYGVLLHDARGRGKSEGTQNAWGWGWGKDIAGALAFLKTRDEVDPERIGALGLSTGADVLVQVAGQRKDLKAVVADGTAAGSFEDTQRVNGITAITPFMAVEFATVRVTSGSKPGPALEGMIKRITSPLLLVSAGPQRSSSARRTTARPVTGRSTSGTCPTSATRPPSARPAPSTNGASPPFWMTPSQGAERLPHGRKVTKHARNNAIRRDARRGGQSCHTAQAEAKSSQAATSKGSRVTWCPSASSCRMRRLVRRSGSWRCNSRRRGRGTARQCGACATRR